MRFAGAQAGDTVETSGGRARPGPAALASLGAGAIHATAVGVHGGHRQAAIAMGLVALFQLGWGAVSLVRSGRWVGWSGLVGHGAAIGGWMMAKTGGIPFVDGLDAAEPLQFADTSAAALATVAAIGALAVVGGPAGQGGRGRVLTPARRDRMAQALRPPATAAVAVFVAVAMLSASAHAHPGDHGSTHDADDRHAHEGESAAGRGPDAHTGGDPDGDGRILDADHPESLVYRVSGDQRTLVSAMYFAEAGTTLAEAPDFGGPLTQWHVHDDLCFSGEQAAWRVGPVVTPPGSCPAPFVRLDLPPMIHVWIVPHRCGPFAALDGASGGQVGEDETVACDHAHGSPG